MQKEVSSRDLLSNFALRASLKSPFFGLRAHHGSHGSVSLIPSNYFQLHFEPSGWHWTVDTQRKPAQWRWKYCSVEADVVKEEEDEGEDGLEFIRPGRKSSSNGTRTFQLEAWVMYCVVSYSDAVNETVLTHTVHTNSSRPSRLHVHNVYSAVTHGWNVKSFIRSWNHFLSSLFLSF